MSAANAFAAIAFADECLVAGCRNPMGTDSYGRASEFCHWHARPQVDLRDGNLVLTFEGADICTIPASEGHRLAGDLEACAHLCGGRTQITRDYLQSVKP